MAKQKSKLEFFKKFLISSFINVCLYCGDSTTFNKNKKIYYEYCDECKKYKHFHYMYWIIRHGMSEEQARKTISDNSRITVEKFIAKYGPEEGPKKFKESHKQAGIKTSEKNKKLREESPLTLSRRSSNHVLFYIDRGYTEDEAKKIIEEKSKEHGKKIKKAKEDGRYDDRLLPSHKEYWLNRGFTEDEAIKNVKERQSTFSLEKCIAKYGEVEGTKRWQERQDKWQKTLFERTDEEKQITQLGKCFGGKGYSKISQELFWSIYKEIEKEDVFFAELNNEYVFRDIKNKKNYLVDFIDNKSKVCIEFNGDIFHANPKMFSENDTPSPFNKEKTAKEIWERDKKRICFLEKSGYTCIVVWESDYRNDKDSIINECIATIKNNQNKKS